MHGSNADFDTFAVSVIPAARVTEALVDTRIVTLEGSRQAGKSTLNRPSGATGEYCVSEESQQSFVRPVPFVELQVPSSPESSIAVRV